ncbi:MAG: hypothetical protein BGO06_12610 [Shinella sp. 65-6]|mgnify:CR=1 FL=1|nr:MAG: hypothetical protein BGO06_12610 [Shinella sp. 65-6]
MFENEIKEHMEVTDAEGQHVGTVDHIEDDRIKLTRGDSPDGRHHFLLLDDVEKVEDGCVWLKEGAATLPEGV